MDAKHHCKTAGLYIVDIRTISSLGCLIIVSSDACAPELTGCGFPSTCVPRKRWTNKRMERIVLIPNPQIETRMLYNLLIPLQNKK